MNQAPYKLDAPRGVLVLQALHGVCQRRGWKLLAAHVRTTHVHVVVEALAPPEKVMNDFKVYASRSLNKAGLDLSDRRRWARHGSTRYLWTSQEVTAAVHYVVCEQGEEMEVFETAP